MKTLLALGLVAFTFSLSSCSSCCKPKKASSCCDSKSDCCKEGAAKTKTAKKDDCKSCSN